MVVVVAEVLFFLARKKKQEEKWRNLLEIISGAPEIKQAIFRGGKKLHQLCCQTHKKAYLPDGTFKLASVTTDSALSM